MSCNAKFAICTGAPTRCARGRRHGRERRRRLFATKLCMAQHVALDALGSALKLALFAARCPRVHIFESVEPSPLDAGGTAGGRRDRHQWGRGFVPTRPRTGEPVHSMWRRTGLVQRTARHLLALLHAFGQDFRLRRHVSVNSSFIHCCNSFQ